MPISFKSTFTLGIFASLFFYGGSWLDVVKNYSNGDKDVKPSVEFTVPSLSSFNSLSPKAVSPELSYKSDFNFNHVVRKGESFSTLFSSNGLMENIEEIKTAFKKEKLLNKGDKLEISLDDKGDLKSILLPSKDDETFVLLEKKDSLFSALNVTYEKEQKERIAVGQINSSFAKAAQKAGLSYRVVDELVDLFAGRFSFQKDFRKGDRFAIIFRDTVREDGKSLGDTKLLAAMVSVKGKKHVAVRHLGQDGKERYFDESGDLIGEAFLRYPLKFSRISSRFSYSRLHPVLKRRRPHLGVDFAAPKGTPVRAVADAKVIKAGRSGGAGIMLKLKHDKRHSTAYLHLSKIAKGVRKSKFVKRGQIIGYVGSTGLSTGPHLDFRFYRDGKSVNPLTVKLPKIEHLNSRTKISKRFLKRVLYTLEHYHKVDLKDFYVG